MPQELQCVYCTAEIDEDEIIDCAECEQEGCVHCIPDELCEDCQALADEDDDYCDDEDEIDEQDDDILDESDLA